MAMYSEKEEMSSETPEAMDVVGLLKQVGDGLSKLNEMVQGGDMDDAEKQAMSAIMDQFMAFTESKVESEEGAPQVMRADQGVVAMNQGKSGQPMGPQVRQ